MVPRANWVGSFAGSNTIDTFMLNFSTISVLKISIGNIGHNKTHVVDIGINGCGHRNK